MGCSKISRKGPSTATRQKTSSQQETVAQSSVKLKENKNQSNSEQLGWFSSRVKHEQTPGASPWRPFEEGSKRKDVEPQRNESRRKKKADFRFTVTAGIRKAAPPLGPTPGPAPRPQPSHLSAETARGQWRETVGTPSMATCPTWGGQKSGET